MDHTHRITIDPRQCGGRPCIRGLRIRVEDVLALMEAGATRQEVLGHYPSLEDDDLAAALAFAARERGDIGDDRSAGCDVDEAGDRSPSPASLSVVRTFLRRLPDTYPVVEAFLFGSRARGDHRHDSDADVAVVLAGEGGQRYRVAGHMAELAFDVMLETGILVDPLPLWQREWQQSDMFGNPALIAAILREGLRL